MPTEPQPENDKLIRRARTILTRIEFLDYKFIVSDSHGGVTLRGSYSEPDVYGQPMDGDETQLTRKWLLNPDMTDSEIVSTAFKCCLTSMEHRTREHFLYRGKRIFGPHFDIEDLANLCKDRENAGGRR